VGAAATRSRGLSLREPRGAVSVDEAGAEPSGESRPEVAES